MRYLCSMVSMQPLHGFTALAHPLSQIRAAEEFFGQVDAFVADEWEQLFVDAPPDEEAIDEVEPASILDALASLGLRFEVAAPMQDLNDRDDDGFWTFRFRGGSFDALLYAWAYKVMDFVELDHRAFFEALRWTDLIFVPDREGVASEAYHLLLGANPQEIAMLEKSNEERATKLFRDEVHRRSSRGVRGEGPRASKPAMIDRAAMVLQKADTAMTPEEIAQQLKHKNLASLTAALHQVVSYGKPKRLAGCLQREGAGRYIWVAP